MDRQCGQLLAVEARTDREMSMDELGYISVGAEAIPILIPALLQILLLFAAPVRAIRAARGR